MKIELIINYINHVPKIALAKKKKLKLEIIFNSNNKFGMKFQFNCK